MTIDYNAYDKLPSKSEYFTRFIKIRSVDFNGNEVELKLKNPNSEEDGYYEYCDKVKQGETREEGVARSLKVDLGLELVTFNWGLEEKEVRNKKGEWLQRIWVDSLVKYRELKDLEVVGLQANWVSVKNKGVLRREEALEWIKKDTTSDLATNRFGNKEEGQKFIEKLYEAGAVKVWADNIEKDELGEHTDNLTVAMPPEKEKRIALFRISNEELQNEFPGEAEEQESAQTELTFWWD